MKKKIEKYIPDALEAVRTKLVGKDAAGKPTSQVYEEYDGYAASFGAAMITSGLLPTLSFYTDVHKKDKSEKGELLARRYRILEALAHVLRKHEHPNLAEGKVALLDYAIENGSVKQDLLAASIALKLALRNFEHIKSPVGHES